MEGITGSLLLLCLIALTNANMAPEIHTTSAFVCEDAPPDSYVFTINATDKDSAELIYSITQPNQDYFTVNRDTGQVYVKRELDRESVGVVQLAILVSDGVNETPKTIPIIVNDTNDNRPIFQQGTYDIEVPENKPVGSTLFRARATDQDSSSAATITYRIDEVTPSGGAELFRIIPTNGDVVLVGNLNFTELSPFYQLKINATDGGGRCYYTNPVYFSSIAYSFITVTDIPDIDPEFLGLPYIGKVEENSPLGQSVFQVSARDPDTQINDVINYSIINSTADSLFQISETGVISVRNNIDREVVGDSVSLVVKATEAGLNIHEVHASAVASVLINIIDVNDHGPVFYKCADPEDELSCVKATEFTGEVIEHMFGSFSINMMVRDADKFVRTRLTLGGEDKDVFSVVPQFTITDSVVQLMVKDPEKLDYEKKQQMVLKVTATDEDAVYFHSSATVIINITDANDNSPTFKQDKYMLKVDEHSPNGTILANITAEDPDTMDQGNITYSLLPDSIRLYFDVDPRTGAVYVKNSDILDREVRSQFSATLQARDTDGKPGSTELEITVIDINDEPPVINRDIYREFVKEGEPFKLQIEATDADDPDTVNSQIVFGIEPSRYSDNFTINPSSGELTNRGELDREALDPKLNGRIDLNVTATDKGEPPLSTMVPVVITVEDVNDNKPQFEAPSYKFSVNEGEKGAFVGSVQAEDLDQTREFNRISFTIIEGSSGSFIIRTFAEGRGYRGNITVDPDVELDFESTEKPFRLQVEAADLEQDKATVMVEVTVLDVNDERPEFLPTEPVTVKENTTISGAVGHFTAIDKDGNHSLVYELVSVQCRCNGSEWTPCDWFILEPTGQVMLNPEYVVDYEHCDRALVTAQVVDKYTEKGENNSVNAGEMMIDIEDINDNAPEFIFSDAVNVVVSESANKATSVARVTATDRDSGTNRQIDFEVVKVRFIDTNNKTSDQRLLFEAITTQQKDIYVGIIQTTDGLDTSLQGKYLISVSATDPGGLSSNTLLEVFAVDKSYQVKLEFQRPKATIEATINEIQNVLTAATKAAVQIARITTDKDDVSRDSGPTFVVAYFIFPNGTALGPVEVETMISDPQHSTPLIQLGLADIGTGVVVEKEPETLQYVLFGMVGGLIIVLGVLTTSLLCTRRNYRRKLKAATAMNSAAMVTSDNQKSGPVVPGTNKYTMEGANPVHNLNIDTTMVLDLDEESSDVDKISLNSLDYSDDENFLEKEKNMSVIREEEEDDEGLPGYIEPLGAALAQRGQKKVSNNPLLGVSNPAFSTTDL